MTLSPLALLGRIFKRFRHTAQVCAHATDLMQQKAQQSREICTQLHRSKTIRLQQEQHDGV